MISRLVAAAAFLAAAPAFAPAFAQDTTFASNAQIQALIAKARAMPPQAVISLPVVSVGPQKVGLDYRTGQGVAAAHKGQDELLYVVQGSGTILLSGTVAGPEKLDGATPRHLAKGDMLFIPMDTPHQLTPDKDEAWALLAFHVTRAK
jgi:mannose-6-phosphate isomerase-like protein (cupin superfamily)